MYFLSGWRDQRIVDLMASNCSCNSRICSNASSLSINTCSNRFPSCIRTIASCSYMRSFVAIVCFISLSRA